MLRPFATVPKSNRIWVNKWCPEFSHQFYSRTKSYIYWHVSEFLSLKIVSCHCINQESGECKEIVFFLWGKKTFFFVKIPKQGSWFHFKFWLIPVHAGTKGWPQGACKCQYWAEPKCHFWVKITQKCNFSKFKLQQKYTNLIIEASPLWHQGLARGYLQRPRHPHLAGRSLQN